MEVLRTAVSALSFYDADEKDNSHDANVRKAYNLTAQIAMIVAIYDRLRKGKEIVPPDRSLSHAGNFLWMLNGVKPSETATRTLDIALVLHADHELNASTFAARVIAATLSDIHSAITGAIGALKGPLHGGANEGVMRLLLTIDKARRRPGGVREEHAGRQAEDLRLRPSRVQDRGSARHPPAQDERATGQGLPASPSGTRCRAPSSSISIRTRS